MHSWTRRRCAAIFPTVTPDELDQADLELVAANSRFPLPRDPDTCPLCVQSISNLAIQNWEKREAEAASTASSLLDTRPGSSRDQGEGVEQTTVHKKQRKSVKLRIMSMEVHDPESDEDEQDSRGKKQRRAVKFDLPDDEPTSSRKQSGRKTKSKPNDG